MEKIKKFSEFLNKNANTFNDLKVVKTTLVSKEAQTVLNKFIDDLPIFQEIVEKGMSKVNRNIELYYDDGVFIGYFIYTFDHFKFNIDKKIIDDDKKSSYKSINIDDIEIRDSIRKNKLKPKYGKMILDKILQDAKKYDCVTLQANNEKLLKDVYPKYGFIDLKLSGNIMVKWN